MYLLTIAIPVYNMGKYLARCLDSVADPSVAEDVEVLIINDGSTDNSLAIAEEYAKDHKNFVVIDKENGGWGTAINRGIKEAKGKYFRNLDSDDWFKEGSLAKVVDALKQGIDSDIILTPFSEVREESDKCLISYPKHICGKTISIEEYLIATNMQQTSAIHAEMFKTAILQDNDIQILPKYYTDIEYSLSAFQYVKTIHIIPIELYQYFLGREGQSVALDSYYKHLEDFLHVSERLCDIYMNSQDKVGKMLSAFIKKNVMGIIRWTYYLLLVNPRQKVETNRKGLLKAFDKRLKQEAPELYRASNKIKRKGLPYVWLWRKTRINLFWLR